MCSDKVHSEVTAHFVKEEWMTNELIEELMHFTPAVYETNSDIDTSGTDHQTWFSRCCRHLFYKGRPFANYRQLDQYASLFMESWKSVKHRDGNSFRCFYVKSKTRSEASCFNKQNKNNYHPMH